MLVSRITSTLAAAVIAATCVTPALAGGEAKNVGPFIGAIAEQPVLQGEPKNEPPFTSPGIRPTVVVTSTNDGFSWIDAAIGAAAGAGATCVAAGLAGLALTSRRRTAAAH